MRPSAFRLGGLFALGWQFSLAGTSWVSLCDRGPYALVRHPQLAARLLIVCSVAMSGADWYGMTALMVCAALTFAVIDYEESMLREVGVWRVYASRVTSTAPPTMCCV